MLATAVAALPLKHVLGQSWKENDRNPTDSTAAVQADTLSHYSKAAFVSYLNSVFQIQTPQGRIDATLQSVEDGPATKGGECFTLQFRGGRRAVRQDTYVITHAALGTFALLLVPSGADSNGAQGYLATINRLSLAEFANVQPPSRSARVKHAKDRDR